MQDGIRCGGRDPQPGQGGRRRPFVEGHRPGRHSTALLVGAEDRTGDRQIGHRALGTGSLDLVRVGHAACKTLGLTAEEQHYLTVCREALVFVETLAGSGDAITNKDHRG